MPKLQRILTGGIFSGSNQSGASAAQALARSGAIFGNTSRTIQGDERLALLAEREQREADEFDRKQTFLEGAGAREVAAEEARFQLGRQRTRDNNQIVTDTLNDHSNQLGVRLQTQNAILNAPGFKNLSKGVAMVDPKSGHFTPEGLEVNKVKGKIINEFIQSVRGNPALHADPNQLRAQVAQRGRAAGLDSATIAQLQADVTESFKVLNPATAKALFDQNKADSNNIAKILSSYAGRSDSSTTGTGSGSSSRSLKGFNKDPNSIQNIEAMDSYIARYGQGSVGIIEGLIEVFTPNILNGNDVSSDRLFKMVAASVAHGNGEVGATEIISAMRSLDVIRGDGTIGAAGDFNPKNVNEVISNAALQNRIITTAKESQKAGRGGVGGDGTTANSRLVNALDLLKASRGDTRGQLNQILSQLTPRQKTGNERAQTARDFVANITGVKSASSLPGETATEADKKVVKDNIINVDTVDAITTPVTPQDTGASTPIIEEDDRVPTPRSDIGNRAEDGIFNTGRDNSRLKLRTGIRSIDERIEDFESVTPTPKTVEAGKQWNDRRMQILGISRRDNMKSPDVQAIVRNDYESNFAEFTNQEKIYWLKHNRFGLTSEQRKQAEASVKK